MKKEIEMNQAVSPEIINQIGNRGGYCVECAKFKYHRISGSGDCKASTTPVYVDPVSGNMFGGWLEDCFHARKENSDADGNCRLFEPKPKRRSLIEAILRFFKLNRTPVKN